MHFSPFLFQMFDFEGKYRYLLNFSVTCLYTNNNSITLKLQLNSNRGKIGIGYLSYTYLIAAN